MPDVEILLDKLRHLRFDDRALLRAYLKFHINVDALVREEWSIGKLETLMFVGLGHEKPRLSRQQVKELVWAKRHELHLLMDAVTKALLLGRGATPKESPNG